MAIVRKEIKQAAKGQLKGKFWLVLGVILVNSIILGTSSATFIGPLVLGGPLALGLSIFLLNVVRNNDPKFSNLFEGFNNFTNSLIAYLLIGLKVILWSLALMVPGIIKSLALSQTFYVMRDNPNIKPQEAMKMSEQMMKGHKWEYFVLGLSFFWWFVLCGITFSIAYIYLAPYMSLTYANFYEKLKMENPVAPTNS
ncbi:MAG TPA: DUF975 family protein [Spirochaetota bacterium]|nr:DUF975 family protein [Spirochaetota bacterium]HOS31651.1 DUF975 family protein [Spirochaetota bacterium]HOS56084.1 DUF975 family protein [Spirochaetota bacterium]HQF77239.1 DUF975 family protein [Spirochaetota bacterium]HQH30060.1 DUF975 family protein [Spirochaetota bacterium]